MRCFALAEAWAAVGGHAHAVLDEHLRPWADRWAAVDGLSASVGEAGAPPLDDSDWAVLDGYGHGAEAQRAARQARRGLVVIDDHGAIGRYDADIVMDQNLGASATAYENRPADSTLLLGPRFALVRRELAALSPSRAPTGPSAAPLTVVLGGDPPAGVVDLLREWLTGEHRPTGPVRVLCGRPETVQDLAGPAVEVIAPATDMAALLGEAELVVAAAGTVTWELCALARPMILLAVADNQVPVAERVADAGAAVYGGRLGAVSARDLAEAVDRLANDVVARAELAARAVELVDGRGAARVVAAIRSRDIRLRPAGPGDCRLYWEWANEPAVRVASFSTDPIPWETHQAWFSARLADPHTRLYVAEDEGRPWGQVRIEGSRGGQGEIAFSIAAAHRGQGLGGPLLRAAVRTVFSEGGLDTLTGDVRQQNVASSRAFETAAFDEIGSPDRPEARRYAWRRHDGGW